MKRKKAIIVGGGIGGLASAIALEKIGWDYVLLEQSPQIRAVGYAIAIWNNGIHCLEVLGVKNLFREKAVFTNNVVVQNHQDKPLTKLNFSNSEILFSSIHRADLINILLQSIPPEKVILNSKVSSFSEDTTGITVQLNSHKEFKGDLLIGADGIHSVIRKKMGDERTLRYAGYTCWRGLVTMDCELSKIGILGMGPNSFYGSAWLKGGKLYWFAVVSTLSDSRKELNLNILKEAFSIWPDSIKEIINRTPSDSIIRNDIYDLPPLKIWGKGRCTLLGDAAHPTTPNLAQGGGMALEDAVELAHSLLNHSHIEQALRAFEKKRYARTTAIVRDSKRFGKMSLWHHPLLVKIRNSSSMIWFSKRGMKKYASYRVPTLN